MLVGGLAAHPVEVQPEPTWVISSCHSYYKGIIPRKLIQAFGYISFRYEIFWVVRRKDIPLPLFRQIFRIPEFGQLSFALFFSVFVEDYLGFF
jgi:hypothetical protein